MSARRLHADVFAAILVGGRGRRAGGRDKARLLRDDGTTFLAHIVSEVEGRVAAVRLAGRAGQRYPEVDAPVIADRVAGAGPLGALDALLVAPPAPWCLLIACDMPRFDGALLDLLAGARAAAPVVVPRTGDRLHPACALYSRRVAPLVTEMLAGPQRSLHELCRRAGCEVVEVPEALRGSLENVNVVRPGAAGTDT